MSELDPRDRGLDADLRRVSDAARTGFVVDVPDVVVVRDRAARQQRRMRSTVAVGLVALVVVVGALAWKRPTESSPGFFGPPDPAPTTTTASPPTSIDAAPPGTEVAPTSTSIVSGTDLPGSTVPAPPVDLHQIGFPNVLYPATACPNAKPSTGGFTLAGGHLTSVQDGPDAAPKPIVGNTNLRAVTPIGAPVFGDLTGDHRDEAVVALRCDVGDGHPVDAATAFAVVPEGPTPMGTVQPVTNDPFHVNRPHPDTIVEHLSIEAGVLVLYQRFLGFYDGLHAADEPAPDPTPHTGWSASHWRWDATGVHAVSPPPTTGVLRSDGVGAVQVGMAMQDFQAATEAPVDWEKCGGRVAFVGPLHIFFDHDGSAVVGISTANAEPFTSRNIHVGSAAADLRLAYPDLPANVADGGVFVSTDERGGRLSFEVNGSTHTVTGMLAGTMEQVLC